MVDLKVAWPPREDNQLLGKEVDRIDGVAKASGAAKYAADINTPGTLYARLLTSPHAHARITSLDIAAARQVPGVKGVYVFPGRAPADGKLYEIRWEGEPLVAVAAESAAQAAEAARAVKIDYEVLDHFVDEFDLAQAADLGLIKPQRDSVTGEPGAAVGRAKHVHTGLYGVHTITHMCLEPHGSHADFQGDKLVVNLSTQNVSGTGGQYVNPLGVDQANVEVNCQYMGGGFGSKFAVDEWDIAAAALSKETGRPVKLLLDRATELKVAGNRPSAFADVTIAADENGKLLGWDSHHWGTNGTGGSTVNPQVMPYVIQPPNRRVRSTGLICNTGPARAWRAPNHPQTCALTCTVIDDLAAEMKQDPYDVFMTNLDLASGAPSDVYAAEMEIAAGLMDWKGKWQPRGKWDDGGWKRGLGMALHTWAGRAGNGTCTIKVNADGTVETFAGTQDLGTGTRTAINVVVAESFGLPLSAVKVNIGNSKYPPSGASGGSTTIGGVSGPHRRACLSALGTIFDKVAAKYDVDAGTLRAAGGKILAGDREICTWKQAAALLGPMGQEFQGEGPKDDGLTSQQVGGVQMVDVSVDPETGRVRINKYVAVQDIGLVVCRKQATSQVLGAMIMCTAYALSEERVMDNATGRFINANLKDYKLPRIGDIGELVVEFYEPDSQYNRGVVGLGEPPVISGGAAISNAVANAIGVRVPVLPLTPKRVLDALANA